MQVLQEMVGTARRMGDHVAAVRHMTFIVQHLFRAMRDAERAELCQQLGALTARAALQTGSAAAPVPHAVDAGFILPPVNIYTVPKVESLKPLPPTEPLHEPAANAGEGGSGPFIFTPIVAGGSGRAARSKAITWVQGELAAVEVKVFNPLNSELRVQEMAIVHEGSPFDAMPTNLMLAPGARQTLRLSGIPREAGEMKIVGYTFVAFGVRSSCRLKNVTGGREESIAVKFCPQLPKLELSVVGQGPAPGESVRVEVFHGESAEVTLALVNASSLPVEWLEASLQGAPIKHRNLVTMDASAVSRVEPGDKAVMAVTVNGPPTKCARLREDADVEREEKRVIDQLRADNFSMKAVVKYSGSSDASSGYSRRVSQSVAVTFRPSMAVTRWDVLPGEAANECYVILDVLSAFESSECEVLYAEGKKVVVDAGGRCRIPLPVAKVAYDGPVGERMRFLTAYLDEHIDLRWRLPTHSTGEHDEQPETEEEGPTCAVDPGLDVGRTGRVSLSGLELDDDMAAMLVLSRVFWSVHVNGQPWTGAEFSLPAGKPTTVELTVENRSADDLRGRLVISAAYVDADEGSRGAPPTPVPCSFGGRTGKRAKCSPGGKVTHRTMLVPAAPGQLCVRCACLTADSSADLASIPDLFVNLS